MYHGVLQSGKDCKGRKQVSYILIFAIFLPLFSIFILYTAECIAISASHGAVGVHRFAFLVICVPATTRPLRVIEKNLSRIPSEILLAFHALDMTKSAVSRIAYSVQLLTLLYF